MLRLKQRPQKPNDISLQNLAGDCSFVMDKCCRDFELLCRNQAELLVDPVNPKKGCFGNVVWSNMAVGWFLAIGLSSGGIEPFGWFFFR